MKNQASNDKFNGNTIATMSSNQKSNIKKTNEWANSILKDLDNLILSNQRYVDLNSSITTNIANNDMNTVSSTTPTSPSLKRSTIINVVLRKTSPSSSSNEPMTMTKTSKLTKPNKNRTVLNATAIINATETPTTNDNNNKILKPEKHVSSFCFISCVCCVVHTGFSDFLYLRVFFIFFFSFFYWFFFILFVVLLLRISFALVVIFFPRF